MSADEHGSLLPDGVSSHLANNANAAGGASDNASFTRYLNRPLLFVSLAMVALTLLLILTYFLPWSHLEPGYDSKPFILVNVLAIEPPTFTLVAALVLFGPPMLYAVCGLLGLRGRKTRNVAGTIGLLIGLWCLLTNWLISQYAGVCDCAQTTHMDIGGWLGISVSLLMPIFAIALLFQEGTLRGQVRYMPLPPRLSNPTE